MSTNNADSAYIDELKRQGEHVLLEMLTVALMRLTAREQKNGGKTCLLAERTYEQSVLNSLQERGFVKMDGKDKPIQITDAGLDAADSAIAMIDEMIDRQAHEMMAEFLDSIDKHLSRREATDAYRLRVEFVFSSDLTCWREIAVPNNFSFLDLHRLLQTLWNWGDYHCFDFQMRHNGKQLVLTDEFSNRCIDSMFAGFRSSYAKNAEEASADDVMLRDVFPRTKNVTYHYDYGDGWEFKIKLLGMMDEDIDFPYLIDGSGDCPPEDVGGEWGFIEFLEIINNPEHPEYEEMREWGKDQGYGAYNPAFIDSRLEAWYYDEFDAFDDEDDELVEFMESLRSDEAFAEYLAKMSLGDDDDNVVSFKRP